MEADWNTMPFSKLTNKELIFEMAPVGYLFDMFNQMQSLPFSTFSIGAIEKPDTEYEAAYSDDTHVCYPTFAEYWSADSSQEVRDGHEAMWRLEDEDRLWC